MDVAIDAKTGNLITADGKPRIGELEDGQPFFHVLPSIGCSFYVRKVVVTEIEIPELGFYSDGSELIATNAFPNKNCTQFAKGDRLGIYLPVTSMPPQVTVTFVYCIEHDYGVLFVKHRQILSLQRSDVGVDCFSTESSVSLFLDADWMYGLVERKNNIFGTVERFSMTPARSAMEYQESGVYEVVIEVQESIRPLQNRYVLASQYDKELRSKPKARRKTSARNKILKDHRLKGRVVFSEDVLRHTLELVQLHPVNDKELPEEHPAIQYLCELWNAHPDVPKELRCARTWEMWVLDTEDATYQYLDVEAPPIGMDTYDDWENSAVIGDMAVVAFGQGMATAVEKDGVKTCYLVNGEIASQIMFDSIDWWRPGIEALYGLVEFNDLFPSHYEKLEK